MNEILTPIDDDVTVRLSCREGDVVFWYSFEGMEGSPEERMWPLYADPEKPMRAKDYWCIRAGEFVTVTTRTEDLPYWFEFHPSELSGRSRRKLAAEQPPRPEAPEPRQAMNVWRVHTGDRMAWVGPPRSTRKGVDGVLALLEFNTCALALGEASMVDVDMFQFFGSHNNAKPSNAQVRPSRAALAMVQRLGIPDCWAPEWRF